MLTTYKGCLLYHQELFMLLYAFELYTKFFGTQSILQSLILGMKFATMFIL